ncbi:MAG: hypothetical protein L0219_10495 [Phycisphaerales bacterium]|nr:hypothetical protein [Phycisphaerales bacterium]
MASPDDGRKNADQFGAFLLKRCDSVVRQQSSFDAETQPVITFRRFLASNAASLRELRVRESVVSLSNVGADGRTAAQELFPQDPAFGAIRNLIKQFNNSHSKLKRAFRQVSMEPTRDLVGVDLLTC